jgi:hypothetical protein
MFDTVQGVEEVASQFGRFDSANSASSASSATEPRSGTSIFPTDPALAGLFPDLGFRRGTVVGVGGRAGSVSLLVAALVPVVAAGSWLGVVGLPALGVEAAAGLGLALDRVALVPDPGGRWLEVVAGLVDAMDVVVVDPPSRCGAGEARRLAARTRERHGLLVVVGSARAVWPEPVDVRLEVEGVAWRGLAGGYGTLERREMEVRSWGRRGAARERRVRVELPSADGRLHPVETADGRLHPVETADGRLHPVEAADGRLHPVGTADTVEPVRILAG